MAAFRVLDPFQTFFNLLSTEPAAGGRVDFFEAGTSTPKAVYANPALSVSNGSMIELDAAGRLSVDCWGDGAYKVRQFDANDTLIKELDYIQAPGGAGQSIPPLENGFFLTNDGALLLWDEVRQPPDPTGQAGKFLKTDGTNFSWEPVVIPPAATPDIVLSGTGASGTYRFGTSAVPKKAMMLFGSDTMVASGQIQATGNFVFPGSFAFDEPPRVFIIPRTSSVSAQGDIPSCSVPSTSTTGFDVAMATTFTQNAARITSPVPFDYLAIGFKTVP